MTGLFEKEIKGHLYHFIGKHFAGTPSVRYKVKCFDDRINRDVEFTLFLDEEKQWKIAAQDLPEYIHKSEYELGCAIEDFEEEELGSQ